MLYITSIGFGTVLSQIANLSTPGSEKAPKETQLVTPLDALYRCVLGDPTAVFFSAEGATVIIGAAWVAATGSILYNRAAIGPVGFACSAIGLSFYAFEACAIFGNR